MNQAAQEIPTVVDKSASNEMALGNVVDPTSDFAIKLNLIISD